VTIPIFLCTPAAAKHNAAESEIQPVFSQADPPNLFFEVDEDKLNPIPMTEIETFPMVKRFVGNAELRLGLL
jgi:hypothetical protein